MKRNEEMGDRSRINAIRDLIVNRVMLKGVKYNEACKYVGKDYNKDRNEKL